MDLNSIPLPEEDEGYHRKRLVESFSPKDRIETSVQTLHREREERRQRMKRTQIDNRDTRIAQPLNIDEGPFLKKSKYERSNLPPGWLDCPNYGQAIGLIIPSKVPLDVSFNDEIPDAKRYSFSKVFYNKRLELGMVVDLTNTDRYYRANELKKRGLKYFKIRCQGRDAVPDNECVNTFVFEVAKYIGDQGQRQGKKYVFVHCTHGHNRTGFMIVHYLMRTHQSGSVFEAIQIFAKARPPGIYKQHYIDALYAFYHESGPDSVTCPPTPEWKRSSEFDQTGAAPQENGDGVTCPSVDEKQENNVMMTNDDVLGDEIPDEQQRCLREICYNILKPLGGRGLAQFPGSHPVSLDRDKLQLLRQRYYYATWKADGTRYMLLLLSDGCYLVDRTFKFRRVQMRFPCKVTTESKFHHYALLDGEMIIDNLGSEKQERRYLIYDLVAVNGMSITERPFYERWSMIEKEIIIPRNNDRKLTGSQAKPSYRYDLEPFRVRKKGFWPLSTVGQLLEETIPQLSHDADGLIFQGYDDTYVPKRHEGLLKWKYPEMNSIDFLFEIAEDGAEHLYLYDKGRRRLMEGNEVFFGDGSDSSSFNGKLIECSWNAKENVWMYMRTRVDKSTPNDINTYRKVMKSIRDNITQDILLSEMDDIIRLPMYADRIKRYEAAAEAQKQAEAARKQAAAQKQAEAARKQAAAAAQRQGNTSNRG